MVQEKRRDRFKWGGEVGGGSAQAATLGQEQALHSQKSN